MKNLLSLCCVLLALTACSKRTPPKQAYEAYQIGPGPDYESISAWSSLPEKEDFADLVPKGAEPEAQADASVDVFFIHPTTFNERTAWNANIQDRELNARTDEWAVKHQASIFNRSCRVYAPRYRQMCYGGFFSKDTLSTQQALDLAYSDVRRAFEWYLSSYNRGRPILIAGHSQGALHAQRLLKEFFDGKELSQQLVAAYIPGWPFTPSTFAALPVCDSPDQTGCVVGWCSWKEGVEPKTLHTYYQDAVVVNPLSWRTDNSQVLATDHLGYVGAKFKRVHPQKIDVQVHQGILWVSSPLPISPIKNFHVGDFNLFWSDVRHNVATRVDAYERTHEKVGK